jgi:hypothetical protein
LTTKIKPNDGLDEPRNPTPGVYPGKKRTAVVGVIHLNVLILVKTPIKPSTNSLFFGT